MKVPNGGGEGEAGEDAMKMLLWYSANIYSRVRKKLKFVVLCWKLLEARNMDILFASESNFSSLFFGKSEHIRTNRGLFLVTAEPQCCYW